MLSNLIVELLRNSPGLSDREITNLLRSPSDAQQPINTVAKKLAQKGIVLRQKRDDGLIGNYLADQIKYPAKAITTKLPPSGENHLTEDQAKSVLKCYLECKGWIVQVAWGRTLPRERSWTGG